MRDKLLALTDFLVKRKDAEGLRLLREVTFDLFCSEFLLTDTYNIFF